MKLLIKLFSLTLAVGFGLPASADKLSFVPGSEARKENYQVNRRINWRSNLEEAEQEATKNGKLIFWVHMLGSMDGKT